MTREQEAMEAARRMIAWHAETGRDRGHYDSLTVARALLDSEARAAHRSKT